jgi:flagellar basal-body rod modification protein FlgD
MQVNSVLNNYLVTAGNTQSAGNTTGGSIDSSQFMQVLMAQLTHQNPLEPMDSAEMTMQFSQLNSLDELRNIHAGMETVSSTNQMTYLTSLLGKTVKANRTDGKVIEGVVDGVITEASSPQVKIGDETIDLVDVLEIKGD